MEPSRAATRITKILQKYDGAVTSAEDRQKIIIQCFERLYVNFWESVAKSRLPVNRRRSQSEEDALQETLLDLERFLRTDRNPFKSGEDILKWGLYVAKYEAIDVYNDNVKEIGASAVHLPATDGAGPSPAEAVALIASMRMDGDPPADVLAQEAELQANLDEFCREVEEQIGLLESPEREIVAGWVDEQTYRELADQFGVTMRLVRNVTFDFKETPEILERAAVIRMALCEANAIWPGLASRIDLTKRGLRPLKDHRSEP